MLHRFFGLVFIALFVFLVVSLLGFTPENSTASAVFPYPEVTRNLCGPVGETCAARLYTAFGYGCLFLLVPLAFAIAMFLGGRAVDQLPLRLLGIGLILCGICTFCSCFFSTESYPLVVGPGGQLGSHIKYALGKHFAETGSYIFIVSLVLGGSVLTGEYAIGRVFLWIFGIMPLGDGIVSTVRRRGEENTFENRAKKHDNHDSSNHETKHEPQTMFRTSDGCITGQDSNRNAKQEREPESSSQTVHAKTPRRKHGDASKGPQSPRFYEDAADEEHVVSPVGEDETEFETENRDEDADVPDAVAIIVPHSDAKPYTIVGSDCESASKTPETDCCTENDDSENRSGRAGGSSLFSWWKKNRRDRIAESPASDESPSGDTWCDATEDDATEDEQEEDVSYILPDIALLTPSKPFHYEVYENTVKRQAKLLEKAFFDFGFNIRVVEIQTGPVIAQFEVQLERGLRLSKILGLTDDLAIALKVPSVRIVAPIPGKNTVGVEVPNQDRQIVRLREVIEETAGDIGTMHIPIFLGKDVSGAPMVIDLTKLPHLLIAGRTGTGKSVCLNSIIVSMLMTRGPEEVRMILIDPKMVELSPYKKIPHLMHPVVTDMKKAEAILGWAVEKMEERYQLLARAGVRQLSEYNNLPEEELFERIQPETDEQWDEIPRSLPYLVIVADEMADLMMTSAKEVETHIIRLAQKSRAVGIHLVLATQKPTVDIITGLIKSNLPARIAFEVASRSDSQVVLDRNGAEKLLGHGDMLFLKPGTSQVLRGQGTYVSDREIEAIMDVIATDHPQYAEELVTLAIDEDDEPEETAKDKDDLYDTAVEFVIREGRGSLSLLQRKYSIGYGRAARLIDRMAEEGIVGPYNGSKSREVVTTLHEWRKKREHGYEHGTVKRERAEHAVSQRPMLQGRSDSPETASRKNGRKPGELRRKMKETAKLPQFPLQNFARSETSSPSETGTSEPLHGRNMRRDELRETCPGKPSQNDTYGKTKETHLAPDDAAGFDEGNFIPIRQGYVREGYATVPNHSRTMRISKHDDYPKVYRIHEDFPDDRDALHDRLGDDRENGVEDGMVFREVDEYEHEEKYKYAATEEEVSGSGEEYDDRDTRSEGEDMFYEQEYDEDDDGNYGETEEDADDAY